MTERQIIEFLQQKAREKNISRYKIYKKTKLSQSTLKRFFNKESSLSLENVIKIAGEIGFEIELKEK